MEGEHGQLAKRQRRRFFEKNRGVVINQSFSLMRDASSVPLGSDSEGSDEEGDADYGRGGQRRGSSQTSSVPLFQPTKKTFFGKSDPHQRSEQWATIVAHWYDDCAESSDSIQSRASFWMATKGVNLNDSLVLYRLI